MVHESSLAISSILSEEHKLKFFYQDWLLYVVTPIKDNQPKNGVWVPRLVPWVVFDFVLELVIVKKLNNRCPNTDRKAYYFTQDSLDTQK